MQIKPTQIHPMSAFCHIRRSFKHADVLCHTCGCLVENVRSPDALRPFIFHSHFPHQVQKVQRFTNILPYHTNFPVFKGFLPVLGSQRFKKQLHIQTPLRYRFIGSFSDSSYPFSPPVAGRWPCPGSVWRY